MQEYDPFIVPLTLNLINTVCMFDVQYDVQQLNESITESQSITEGCADGEWSQMCGVAAAEWAASPAGEVVGTAPTQLESCNELIRLDHEYYRMASPLGDDVAVSSEDEVVCEVEVCSDEPTTVVRHPSTECAILPSVCDLDLSVLADPELWENLEQIIDADQLLGQPEVPPLVTSASVEIPSPQMIQISGEEEPPKQMDDVKISSLHSTEGFTLTSPLHDSTDTFSVEPWSSQSSRSDPEASSSGIGSPFSDDLVDMEDYGFHWEESFMELFPALI